MPDDNFGERAATTAEVTSWLTLVQASRAPRSYKLPANHRERTDRMRPNFGTSVASSEDGE